MADQIIAYTEEMVGSGHPTKSDTLNRALLIGHNADGTHKAGLIQIAHASSAAVISGSTTMPDDDTIPQNTEGFEVLTCAITPKNVNNLLLIIANLHFTYITDTYRVLAALFQDSTAGALAAIVAATPYSYFGPRTLTHKMTAGTISSTTFKIRCGPNGACTLYLNSIPSATGRIFGGVASTTLTVMEYAP